jgi:cyclic pyranopterin monophosphate synthase
MSELSHYDESGRARMVDVSDKPSTKRVAVASAKVLLSEKTLEALRTQTNPKGDPLEVARIAGIMAAKRTSELIPLCHQIPLSKVNVDARITESGIELTAEAITTSQTGVEMEALDGRFRRCSNDLRYVQSRAARHRDHGRPARKQDGRKGRLRTPP